MNRDVSFEDKATAALSVGEEYLNVENGHLTRIDRDGEYWKAIASTDPSDGEFPAGLRLDLGTTYCRRTTREGSSVALHDAPNQGWADDPAYDAHELRCYHGTPIALDDEPYGTVCFVSTDARDESFSADETLFAELIARMIENELQRDRTMAKVERLDQFASVVSHDLRSPLNVAQGRVEFERSARESDHLEAAAGALDRMERLIADVLTMARQGQEIERTETVSLGSIVEECWESISSDAATVDVVGGLRFKTDPNRVRLLFENLFRNAVEHGGADVSIRIGPLSNGDGFYVEDDGPGIPESDRDRIFDTGYSTGRDGIGLGLSIVSGIVEAHDWSIVATEGSEGGARFEIDGVVVP